MVNSSKQFICFEKYMSVFTMLNILAANLGSREMTSKFRLTSSAEALHCHCIVMNLDAPLWYSFAIRAIFHLLDMGWMEGGGEDQHLAPRCVKSSLITLQFVFV
jgi:hypothetical protein